MTGGGDGLFNPSEELRKKIGEQSRITNTGRKLTEEYKAQISKRMREHNPNAGGKLLTPDRIEQFRQYAKLPKTEIQKQRMSESAKKRKVLCAETGEIFDSMKSAASAKNITYSTLASAAYRGNKTGGYSWILV